MDMFVMAQEMLETQHATEEEQLEVLSSMQSRPRLSSKGRHEKLVTDNPREDSDS
jgi:hypothetical protein